MIRQVGYTLKVVMWLQMTVLPTEKRFKVRLVGHLLLQSDLHLLSVIALEFIYLVLVLTGALQI